ncbi:4-(cytidine 5'-diphospho)-2-C-methyl-D-erythritol kinase [Pseudorhodoferax sp. Leaf267]|uniref:4-(cytidine 5'-diphospho)-2-C-methyl-D-erythritol kinase n=1 Tax=Pseudorhodoferax sp. Leaf267 TaxID=1736316 RepID=UPI0006FED9DB|nr:4-(cytidine 5'-diphospho)-2-C-methyl-D-erythritol kinase [Pseudorhodoferax sp. Leaf267]KQP14278.1 4-diphosphocytidyl-2C-methyl-D-erythritol kinase [Pseudorhodoferax sp. Leaf267]
MKAIYDIAAPAKLNLFLHITGRRSDGYHLLQSAFMLIDWHDSLHVELRHDGQLSREDLGPVLPADDLTLRAARALQRASGTALGAHIGVLKRIPSEAGMGGGSSDAASCLLALNRLWKLDFDLRQLSAIGLSLGADVPFFLGGRNAWVEGIGESMQPIELPAARFLVVKTPAGLETAKIFASPQLKRDTDTAILLGFAADPYGFGHNDLQPVAQTLCADVGKALEWLAAAGAKGRMTGSGSAVFAPWHQAEHPAAPEGWQVRLCSNLDVHPLAGWAVSQN